MTFTTCSRTLDPLPPRANRRGGLFNPDLPRLCGEDLDQWFAELANFPFPRRRDQLVESISHELSRFTMIDEDILCSSLSAILLDCDEDEIAETAEAFSL